MSGTPGQATLGERKSKGAGKKPRASATAPRWFAGVPFVLSAVLYLSGVFAVFSPLPLMALSLRGPRWAAWTALVTNFLLVALASGTPGTVIYSVFVVTLVLSGSFFLRRMKTLEKAGLGSFLAMMGAAAAWLAWQSWSMKLGPAATAQAWVGSWLDLVMSSVSLETRQAWLGDLQPEEWKQALLEELPAMVGILGVVFVWANFVALVRLNPARIRERMHIDGAYFIRWKTPELLVWPTLAAGFLVAFAPEPGSLLGLNLFKVFMSLYALQGLSILAFLFEVWGLKGVLRPVGYVAALFLMMPLVLGAGFFDLWFDFRAKLRQS